jgi:hypothetical protein
MCAAAGSFDGHVSELQPPTPGCTIATFGLLVLALSVPVWLAGAAMPVQLLPGLPATTPSRCSARSLRTPS